MPLSDGNIQTTRPIRRPNWSIHAFPSRGEELRKETNVGQRTLPYKRDTPSMASSISMIDSCLFLSFYYLKMEVHSAPYIVALPILQPTSILADVHVILSAFIRKTH